MKTSWVRVIYLYLFSLVGLTLLIIGAVGFINMGLKTFLFTDADQDQRLNYNQPIMPASLDKIQNIASNSSGATTVTVDEKTAIVQWLADYQNWKQRRDKVDIITAQRQREASSNLAMIIVGLPLFLYHWRLARKEAKNSNA